MFNYSSQVIFGNNSLNGINASYNVVTNSTGYSWTLESTSVSFGDLQSDSNDGDSAFLNWASSLIGVYPDLY